MSEHLSCAGHARPLLMAADTPTRPGMRWPPSGATPEHMAAINALPGVLAPLAPEDVFVRGVYALNDLPLTGQYEGLVVPAASVTACAELARDKPVQCNHDYGSLSGAAALPVARLFASDVVAEGAATWLRVWSYWVATDKNAELVQRIDGGNIAEVSCGISFGSVTCTVCGLALRDCPHVPMAQYGGMTCLGQFVNPQSFMELSLVWAGAAQGTHFFMAAGAAGRRDSVAALLERKRKVHHGMAHFFPPREGLEERFFKRT